MDVLDKTGSAAHWADARTGRLFGWADAPLADSGGAII
jgi:hypothetical protein